MSNVAELHHVSKLFYSDIGVSGRYALLDMVMPARLRRFPRRTQFYALRDVSLAIPQGQTVAVLGGKASGKTTMAKLLTNLQSPNVGRVRVSGRTALVSNLVVGFKPMLSVRENVVFKSVLMGMEHGQAVRRADELLDFAELSRLSEKKLFDLPSELLAKLGYTVCLHSQPDLFVIDGFGRIGDDGFQARCAERVQELVKTTTMVLLTDRPNFVEGLASVVVVLEQGRLLYDGEPSQGYRLYEEVLADRSVQEAAVEGTDLELHELFQDDTDDLEDPDLVGAAGEESLGLSAELLSDRKRLWRSLDLAAYTRFANGLGRPKGVPAELFDLLTPEQRYVNSRHFAKKSLLVLRVDFNQHDVALRDVIPLVPSERPIELSFAFTPRRPLESYRSFVVEFFDPKQGQAVESYKLLASPATPLLFNRGTGYTILLKVANQRLPVGQYGVRVMLSRKKGEVRPSDLYKLAAFSVVGERPFWSSETEIASAPGPEWTVKKRRMRKKGRGRSAVKVAHGEE